MSIGVGLALQPDEAFLDLLGDALRADVDYLEVAPETIWRGGISDGPGSTFASNRFADRFLEIGADTGLPFVAHGVGLSIGSHAPTAARRERWLKTIERDHARFAFQWYTDHLGSSELDGREITLPIGLPYTAEAAAAVQRSLGDLQRMIPSVGFENSAFYFHLGDPLDEPAWIAQCLQGDRQHLLLDLHNVYTNGVNAGFDPAEYLARLPMERVIEIHVSGGSWSDTGWLASGRSLRLDSHDAEVPGEVWTLLEDTLPCCPNLRGVTLERMEGTVRDTDVAAIRDELHRIRTLLGRRHAG